MLCHYTVFQYAECGILFIITLNAIMLSVIMPHSVRLMPYQSMLG